MPAFFRYSAKNSLSLLPITALKSLPYKARSQAEKYLKSVTAEDVYKRLSLLDNEKTVLSVIRPITED